MNVKRLDKRVTDAIIPSNGVEVAGLLLAPGLYLAVKAGKAVIDEVRSQISPEEKPEEPASENKTAA